MKSVTSRFRWLGALAAAVALNAATPAWAADANDNVLRIGYQKYGTLILLKATGALEKRLAPLGIKVTWSEFPAGPQLLEGLNVGSIDFGTTGETPPVFAQAAGANLNYIGHEPPAPTAEAIVVPKGSPIKSVADLKGKNVALNKGSNVHYLLVRALEKAGLKYSDIKVSYLKPADARAAFERGSVDAWVIWEPFLSAAEVQIGARVLADGKGVVDNHQFYLSEKTYGNRHPEVIAAVFDEIKKVDEWVQKSPHDAAVALAPLAGLDVATTERALTREGHGVNYLNDDVVAAQQRIADTFTELNLIPKKLDVKSVVWTPKTTSAKK